jgi:hypothetical protein
MPGGSNSAHDALPSDEELDTPKQPEEIHLFATSNVAQYQLDMYIPRLKGRVIDILPDEPGSTTGKGVLKVAKRWFATTDTIPTVSWPVPEKSDLEDRMGASYQGDLLPTTPLLALAYLFVHLSTRIGFQRYALLSRT